ncbi:MAG: efflux RND transporter periplasmic adaptor subunit [Opitutaceae bacterium]|nr:efflux RND transporter periplasmic adaptor subunit [Verrucomicrobiales bacterium]
MSQKKKSGWLKWVFVLLVLGGAGAWAWFHFQRPAAGSVEFKTTKLSLGDVTQSVSANGQISPIKTVAVGSQISGQITNLTVDFNSTVKEGQLLAEIDSGTYVTRLKSAKADLANAQASLDLAEVNFRRSEELLRNNLIPKSDYDQTKAQLQQARAQLQTREASVATAEVDLSRCTIFAPISGMVINRNVDVGQTVAASLNTPTLFTIANDLRKMQIDALVSEADVGNVAEGQNVEFTVDAFPGRPFQGQIRQVRFAAITNQNVVNYSAIIDVNNDDLKLRPGMTTTASIITGQKKAVLRVAKSAFRVKPPDNLILKDPSSTNAPSKAAAGSTPTANAGTSGGRRGAPEGFPTPPWSAEGRRPTPEELKKWQDSLTPEQREQMAQRRGGGGGRQGGAGGAAPRPRTDGPVSQSLYLLVKTTAPDGKAIEMAKKVTVKTGLDDASNVEVLEGLKEGDEIITAVISNEPVAAVAARPGGPGGLGGNPFGEGGGRGGR